MDQLNGGVPRLLRRLWTRLASSFVTWPDARGWAYAAGVGATSLAALGALGFASGLYSLHPANLAGMPLRLISVIFVPAIGEETIFRGLLVPGRGETDRPWAWLAPATLIFIAWHLIEAWLILPVAAPLFERADFLTCAGLLGLGCGLVRWRTGSIWPAVALHWLMVTIWQTWLGGFIL